MTAVLFDQGERFRVAAELGQSVHELPSAALEGVPVDLYGPDIDASAELVDRGAEEHGSSELRELARALGKPGIGSAEYKQAS